VEQAAVRNMTTTGRNLLFYPKIPRMRADFCFFVGVESAEQQRYIHIPDLAAPPHPLMHHMILRDSLKQGNMAAAAKNGVRR
jgi:hypothetical protein